MRQAAVKCGLVDRIQILLEMDHSRHPGDSAEALVKLAHLHNQDDAAAVLQAHMAAKALDSVLPPALGTRAPKN